jgi:hypothetical protein
MKKKAPAALLMATLIAVFFLHIGLATTENGTLLVVDNQEFDFLGVINNKWNRFTRSCNSVSRLSPNEQKYQIAQSLIQNYSPPHSKSAMIASAWSADTWTLVEVEFADLLPAVVIIQTKANQPSILANAVWSGYTKPWESAPFIRKYMSSNAHGAPLALISCFEPQSQSFK